jgi:putative ABC transport system substrate-binding protein
MKRIGIIVAGSAYPIDGFKSGLRDLGWVDGEGIRFELRTAEGQLHLLPKFASEMVNLGVDLIAVIGAVTVRAVRQATSRIPIVFAVVVEPVGDGLAANLERPGGNVTGVTTFDPQQAKAQLGFLRAINPAPWASVKVYRSRLLAAAARSVEDVRTTRFRVWTS